MRSPQIVHDETDLHVPPGEPRDHVAFPACIPRTEKTTEKHTCFSCEIIVLKNAVDFCAGFSLAIGKMKIK